MVSTVQLWLFSWTLVALASAKHHECLSSGLLNEKNPTPPLTIGSGITLRLKPQNAVKQLIIHAALEDDNEQEVYELGITENMQVVWGDMEVTLKDSKTRNNVFKVPWPPILITNAWTTIFLRLHYHHLLQLALIPHEAMNKPRDFVHSQIFVKPAAITANLDRFGVTKLRLKRLTSNISIQYTVNCGQEFLATSFASEFGILSGESFWRNMTWIFVGIMSVTVVILILTFIKICYDRTKQKPNSFILARFQSGGKESVSPGPVMVSSTRGGKQKESREAEDGCGLQPPRVTVGVVSSRAPSPGNEVDETTMDYVNKAFLYEN
ncbi:uncharacterized protein LOC123516637 [Portunus trituberculatus]|uniref:uncharacterized protein LOC123516637 n=1 Tax=Portunus trituberculatus TaxID=210409 RepID=UPI001E1CD278|nr:uncharacterized protein LOC123516637 [Portunus trituberculatus]